MPLQKRVVPVTFGQGVDTKTDNKLVVPGKLRELLNGTFTRLGSIGKRFGHRPISNLVLGTEGVLRQFEALSVWNDELCAYDGKSVYTYLSDRDRWLPKGSAVSCVLRSQEVVRDERDRTAVTTAVNGGLSCSVYVVATEIRATVRDTATGATVAFEMLVNATGSRPSVLAFDNYFVVLYGVGGNLNYRTINITNPTTVSAQAQFTTDLDTVTKLYDAVVVGNYLWAVYNNSSAGISYRRMSSLLQISSVVAVHSSPAVGAITIFEGFDQDIWMAWYTGTNIRHAVRSYTQSVITAPTVTGTSTTAVARIVGHAVTKTVSHLYLEESAAAVGNHRVTRLVAETVQPSTPAAAGVVRSLGLASKPWRSGLGDWYLALSHQSVLQSTYFVYLLGTEIADCVVAGKISPGTGGGLIVGQLSEVDAQTDGTYLLGTQVRGQLVSEAGNLFTNRGVKHTSVDFVSDNSFQNRTLGQMHVVGGVLQSYDGVSVTEHGFHLYPEGVGVGVAASGGAVTNGQHQYVAIYEWTDNLGQVHRSTPSVPVTVSNTGTNISTNTVTIPTLRVTAKQGLRSQVRVVVYRTEANGTIFYRVTSPTSPLLNNTGVDTVSFVDTLSDDAILANELLYTTGSVVENAAPPSCSSLTTYRNRLVLSGIEGDSLLLAVSKTKRQGVGVEFSDFFTRRVDPFGGDITTVAAMDDKLIIFKEGCIFFTSGDGPDDTAASDDLAEPVLVSTDVGCARTAINSVVLMPEGLMFRSAKGLYRLNRNLTTEYIGDAVEAYNGEQITAGVLVAEQNHVRFTTAGGPCLVYDYLVGQWSTFTNLAATDAVLWRGQTVLAKPGATWVEDATTYRDAGQYVAMRVVTAWLNFQGIQTLERVYRMLMLGDFADPHTLRIRIAYDMNPVFQQQVLQDLASLQVGAGTPFDPETYGELSPYGSGVYGGSYPLYQLKVRMSRQKCQSVSFCFEDLESTESSTGAGFSIAAMSLEVGIKGQPRKMAAGATLKAS